MKAIKITNPVWLGEIAPKINDYADKVKIYGIDYTSMYSYLRNVVQFGGVMSELWVVMDSGKPVAFANWSVRPLPYVATAGLDNIYKWVKNTEPVELLMKEYINFALGKRCVNYYARCNNKYIVKLLDNYCANNGYTLAETGAAECVMQKEK